MEKRADGFISAFFLLPSFFFLWGGVDMEIRGGVLRGMEFPCGGRVFFLGLRSAPPPPASPRGEIIFSRERERGGVCVLVMYFSQL